MLYITLSESKCQVFFLDFSFFSEIICFLPFGGIFSLKIYYSIKHDKVTKNKSSVQKSETLNSLHREHLPNGLYYIKYAAEKIVGIANRNLIAITSLLPVAGIVPAEAGPASVVAASETYRHRVIGYYLPGDLRDLIIQCGVNRHIHFGKSDFKITIHNLRVRARSTKKK